MKYIVLSFFSFYTPPPTHTCSTEIDITSKIDTRAPSHSKRGWTASPEEALVRHGPLPPEETQLQSISPLSFHFIFPFLTLPLFYVSILHYSPFSFLNERWTWEVVGGQGSY